MNSAPFKGDVTQDDLQWRFLAQHSITTLLRHCFEWLQQKVIVPTLLHCVVLKIVFANHLVYKYHGKWLFLCPT